MILDTIVWHKQKEIAVLKRKESLSVLAKDPLVLKKRSPVFLGALSAVKSGMAVIAEIKRKSPSRGLLCKNFDPLRIARQYEAAGANALSVLTDEKFFGGSVDSLKVIRSQTKLPILRKDFIIDEYQIYESKRMGADAILLIASILSESRLRKFSRLAKRLGLDVLFEVHTVRELKKILKIKPLLIGVNNRNLKNFTVDIRTTQKLAKFVPKNVFLISESGIKTPQNLVYLRACGAKAVLVGESLMAHKNPGQALRKLLRV